METRKKFHFDEKVASGPTPQMTERENIQSVSETKNVSKNTSTVSHRPLNCNFFFVSF